jgi:hypothetical protein
MSDKISCQHDEEHDSDCQMSYCGLSDRGCNRQCVAYISPEIDPDDSEIIEQYEDMLRDTYGRIDIAGIGYDVAWASRKLDPIAYRCGLLDYIDGLER